MSREEATEMTTEMAIEMVTEGWMMDKDEIIYLCTQHLQIKQISADQYMSKLTLDTWGYICLKIAVMVWDKAIILNLLKYHGVRITNIQRDINIFNYAISLINGTNINSQKLEIIRLLLEYGATPLDPCACVNNRTLLMDMSYRLSRIDNYEAFVELISILDEYKLLNINSTDSNGQTALMYLCRETSFYNIKIQFIKLLIDKYQADVFIRDNNGNNALMNSIMPYITTIIPRDTLLENRNQLIRLFMESRVDINIVNNNGMNLLYLLYHHRQKVSPEIHLLLCTPHSINSIDNGCYNMNALQYLCAILHLKQPQLQLYLTQILSKFSDIDALYNALMHKSRDQRSAFEYITQYGSQEHKDLAQIICCKVERRELLTYISATKKIDKNSLNCSNIIQLCLFKMGIIPYGTYLLRGVGNKLGKAI